MEELTTVYVFASSNGDLGFSVKASGSNLPPLAGGWERSDSVPMTASALARLVPDPHTAIVNLIMRGCHVSRAAGSGANAPRRNRG